MSKRSRDGYVSVFEVWCLTVILSPKTGMCENAWIVCFPLGTFSSHFHPVVEKHSFSIKVPQVGLHVVYSEIEFSLWCSNWILRIKQQEICLCHVKNNLLRWHGDYAMFCLLHPLLEDPAAGHDHPHICFPGLLLVKHKCHTHTQTHTTWQIQSNNTYKVEW